MCQKPSDADSEACELKIVTFEIGQPEEFLHLMNNFKRSVDRTGTTTAVGKINYVHTLLRGEALRYFDKLASQNAGTNSSRLNFVQEGLLGYFFRLTPFPIKIARCAAQCVNLNKYFSSASLPASRN